MDDGCFAILRPFQQCYQDNGRLIIKGCVQWSSVYGWEDFASSGDRTRSAGSVGQHLTHWATGAPIMTAADDIHKYCFIVFQRNQDLMFQVNPRQRIHIKDQALFSSKDKSKKLKCRLLQFLFGALRVSSSLVVPRRRFWCGLSLLHGPTMLADKPTLWCNALYSIQLLSVLRKHLVVG